MKNNKGVTMVTLVVTIVIMIIITGTVITQSISGMETRKINDLYNDLRLIKDKVSMYYYKYNTLPIGEEYDETDEFKSQIKSQKNINDGDKYYIINLEMLDNITLNYTEGDGVFIINEDTHTIYYPKGLEVDGNIYYTLPDEYSKID